MHHTSPMLLSHFFPIRIVTNPTSVSPHNSVTSWAPPGIYWAEYLLACVAHGPLWFLCVSLLCVQTDGKKCEDASGSGLVGLPPVLMCPETVSVGIRLLRLRNQKGPGWLPPYSYQTFWGITWQSWMWLFGCSKSLWDCNIQYLTCWLWTCTEHTLLTGRQNRTELHWTILYTSEYPNKAKE